MWVNEMVQIGTQLYREGINCFSRINKELIEILKKNILN